PLAAFARSRQAEIDYLHSVGACFEPNVGGLDIAVDQVGLMGRRQAKRTFAAKPQYFFQTDPAFPFAATIYRRTYAETHRQERYSLILADMVDGDNMIMSDGRIHFGFMQKPLAGLLLVRSAGKHGFDGHNPIQVGIQRTKYDAHASGANNVQHAVAAE